MKTLALALCLSGAGLFAQTADLRIFRAVMLPSNEIPATPAGPKGVADIIVHVVKDASGTITTGTVQFTVRSTFPTDQTFTGLHIHNGAAGVNAGVVIGTNLTAAAPALQKGGAQGVVERPVYVDGSNTTALTELRKLWDNPSGYYVNIHSTEFTGGVIRGQLERADTRVLMGLMNADNEFPAVTNGVKASGVAQAILYGTWDSSGKLTSGEVFFATTYTISIASTFTGFHIHPGLPGTAGPVAIGSNLPAGIAFEADTPGLVQVATPTEIDLTNNLQVSTFNGVFADPGSYYINIHTQTNTGGVMRAPLRNTDRIFFPVLMDSANEPGTINVKGTGPAQVIAFTLRNEDGSVAAGTVVFDVNYRFPGPFTVTGLHIHDGVAGVNGGVTIPMIANASAGFAADAGTGNYFNWTPPIAGGAALATLDDMMKSPEKHYVNLHTATDTGGAIRSQLTAAPVKAAVAAVISASQDKRATTGAPAMLMSVYGTNLSRVSGGLDGWQGKTLPASFNGASVTVGGKVARIFYADPFQVIVSIPTDAAMGAQPVVVDNGSGASAPFSLTVAPTAPAIFIVDFDKALPAIRKNSDFSLVTADNPAGPGDIIVTYATGMGNLTPAYSTGQIVGATDIARTAAVTATIGGKAAEVIYSIATPGTTGVYQVATRVPDGVSGASPMVWTMGAATSNTVTVQLK